MQVTISRREDTVFLTSDRKISTYVVVLYDLIQKKKNKEDLDNIRKACEAPYSIINSNIEPVNFKKKISYRRLFYLSKKSEFKALTLDQAKNYIEMYVQSKEKYLGTNNSFVNGMKDCIEHHTDAKNVNRLIKRSYVSSSMALNVRSNGMANTKTGFKTFDTILRMVMTLDKRERNEFDKYYHPMIPYTWKPGVVSDDQFCERFLKCKNPLDLPQNAEDLACHPYFFELDGAPVAIDQLKVSDLDKIYQPGFHKMKDPHPYDKNGYTFLNPQLYDGVKVLSEQSYKKDTRTISNPSEYATFIDLMYENQPRDEFGFPLEISPPDSNVEAIAAHGPKSTAGGVDRLGNRHTKTNLYHSSVTEALQIIQACKNLVEEIATKPLLHARNATNRIIMSPLMSSVKNEIVKRGKKMRFFTLTQAPFEILETFVYAQILDNSRSVTYDSKGGNRLMIGNSLERGYGQYLINTMITRNNEDLEGFLGEIKSFNPKDIPPDFNDEDYYSKSDNKPFPILGKSRSFVTDYSSQEFQHNTVHRLLSLIATHKFYVSREPEKNVFFMIMAVVGELTTQVDVDLGNGYMLLLPPGHVGSGCKLTLLGNGNSNKFELNNATLEAALSLKRGHYYTVVHRVPVEEAYVKTIVPIQPEPIIIRTIQNLHNNAVFQGDDGYLATLTGSVEAFKFVITIMKDTYSNQIKADVHNLLALHDNKGYDLRQAGDFLKIKPTITKNGVFFIRDTAVALQKMFYPNSLPFNATTQLFAAISQSYTSNGNYFSYKLASYKIKMISSLLSKEKLNISDDDKNAYITVLETQKEVKNNAVIEHLITNGFNELDFSVINQKFLKPDVILIHEKQDQTGYYRQFGMSKNMVVNMRLGYTK